jgi:Uma2 family endonuclease
LIFPSDDAIVVGRRQEGAMDRLSVSEYFTLEETTRPMELVYGVVREPPMPAYGHQLVAARLTALLYVHVEQYGVGQICSPVDVVLDKEAALVVQPDLVFISRERLGIVSERVWGAPDLVVEILSPRTARRDRTVKLGWYRKYGVRECWLVDGRKRTVEVIELQAATPGRLFTGTMPMRSYVLPRWTASPDEIFG